MKIKNLALASVLGLTMLTGCGSTKSNDKVEITFWHAMSGVQEKTLENLTKKFEKANPNIDVKLENQGQYKDLQAKVTTAQGSTSSLPNITQAYGDWLEKPIEDGLVKSLDIDTKDFVNQFVEPLKINGKLYGVPFAKSTEIMVYNKTIVDELGLKLPTTPEEYYEFCKTIHEKTGMYGGGFDNLSNFYQTYLYNEGVDLNKKTDLLGSKSIEACKYLQKGMQNKAFKQAGTDMYLSGPFGSEKVASYIGTNAGLPFMEKAVNGKFEYGVMKSPMGKTIQQGTDLFVFKKDKKQDQASEKYLEFLTSEQSQIEWGNKTGYVPMNKKSVANKDYDFKYADLLQDVTKNLYSEPINIKRNKLYLQSRVYLEKISNGQNIKEVLKQYENERNNIFK